MLCYVPILGKGGVGTSTTTTTTEEKDVSDVIQFLKIYVFCVNNLSYVCISIFLITSSSFREASLSSWDEFESFDIEFVVLEKFKNLSFLFLNFKMNLI